MWINEGGLVHIFYSFNLFSSWFTFRGYLINLFFLSGFPSCFYCASIERIKVNTVSVYKSRAVYVYKPVLF
ncbi:hypothetical protein OMAG_002439 [Candidatus Omnitrophus magneticus]|uniref:Uncharacterized protein n=1 Tax=Candidatus Omnitrophus magneticus TaxID=1609969 RepID=A0A0F0CKE0_9BACT|nr:hypothetical protein OMAG_002439 [Candidatus Omnitrophus magneticus]